MFQPLFRGRAIGSGFIALAAVVATAMVIARAPAAGTGPEGVTTFSGSTAGAVAYSHNSSTGTAIEGVTGTVAGGKAVWGVANNALNAGTGVRATAYGPSSFGLFGEAINTNKSKPSYGLYATSKSSYAVYAFTNVPGLTSLLAYNSDATSNGSHAIRAQSRGDAITGVSTGNNGVVGQVSATPTPMPSADFALAGVLGRDTSTGTNNVGVAGTSTSGIGVNGFSKSNSGVNAVSLSGDAIDAFSSTSFGVLGISNGSEGVVGVSGSNNAVRGSSTSGIGGRFLSVHTTGVLAESYATPRPDATTLPNSNNIFTAALAVIGHSGAPLIIARRSGGTDVMSLDDSGSLILTGSVTSPGGTPLVVHRTTLGRDVITYSGHQSLPSIEDFGEAQLVNGQAYVRLDSTFAATIDPRARYLVFITPSGDNRGLYVAQRSVQGFLVRESQGGRSTLAFDYRIVAKPLGSTARHLPLINLPAPGVNPPQPRPVTLPLLRNQTRP